MSRNRGILYREIDIVALIGFLGSHNRVPEPSLEVSTLTYGGGAVTELIDPTLLGMGSQIRKGIIIPSP